MLQSLHIINYAIIDDLRINFGDRFSVITGETGAGKSIIMGALDLVVGGRADTSVLADDKKKCIAEAVFHIKVDDALRHFFADNELDLADEIIIRREITGSGKSRAFINDSPVNLAVLRELGSMLVDIHQQFDTLTLTEQNFQRSVLDSLAGNQALLAEMDGLYSSLSKKQNRLQLLIAERDRFTKERDYKLFLLNELQELGLKEFELETIASELETLNSSEEIQQLISTCSEALSNGEAAIVPALKSMVSRLSVYASKVTVLTDAVNRLNSVYIELDDVTSELDRLNDHLDWDPGRAAELNERLSAGYKLQKKHGVQSTGELLALQKSFEKEIAGFEHSEEEINELEAEIKELEILANGVAKKLNAARTAAANPFLEKANELLVKIGMPNARLKVQIGASTMGRYGADKVEFLFDANNTGKFEPVHKVASGGELSRLMLVVKSLVARKLVLPTLIFDEIDTGISGEAAKQVGAIMQGLADVQQVVVISHQPQVAARAHQHYFVHKIAEKNKIVTRVKTLNNDERIFAVAQMIGGEKPSASTLENAKEMIQN